jgi:hypothetical protein
VAKIATLTDAFPGSTLNGTNWYVEPDAPTGNPSGTATVSGGTLSLSGGTYSDTSYYTSVNSHAAWDLTGSHVFLRLIPNTANADYDTGLALLDSGIVNGIAIGVAGGDLYVQQTVAGAYNTVHSAAYNATSHAWVRISEAAGTITFATAPDGVTWTTFYTSTTETINTWSAASSTVQMYYGSVSGAASPSGNGQFQSFNALPVLPGAASLSGRGTLTGTGTGGTTASALAAFTAGTERVLLAEGGGAILLEGGTPILLEGGLAGATLTALATAGPPGNPTAFLTGAPSLHAFGLAFTPGITLSAAPVLTAAATAAHPGAHMSASPVLRAAPRVIIQESAHLAAGPVMTASGFVPVLLARPVLSAAGQVIHAGVAPLHASPALSAATSQSVAYLSASPRLLAPGKMAAARLLAGTSLTASGLYFMPGQAALYAGTSLTAGAHATTAALARLSASTALAAAALNTVRDSAALSAAIRLSAAVSSSAAHLSAGPSLGAAGQHAAVAAAGLHAPGSAVIAAKVTERASAALHGSAALSAQAVPSRAARGHLSAAAVLSAAGATHKDEAAAAVLRAATALRAAGLRTTFGTGHLSSAPALSAHGARTAVARAQLAAQAQAVSSGRDLPGVRLSASPSLAAPAVLSRTGRTLLSGGAKLTGTAHGTTFPKGAFRAPGLFTPAPNGIVQGASSLACSPSLAALALTRPGLPFPLRPKGQQPTWQRDVQRFAVVQERQRHAQALWQYGELAVFALMWRPEDIGAGLARRCTRCYTPAEVISGLPPGTLPPPGWPTAAVEAQISSAYGQGNQFRCTLCYGTQVIAAGTVPVPGVRALIVRPAILTDTDQNQQRSAKGVVNTGQVAVQSTPDFRVNTLDYFFRADGRRYQLAVPARTTLRTGFGSPWQEAASISYNLASAALEDPKASVAYVIPPAAAQLEQVLGTYTRIPADYAWFEQVNGPLIPGEEPSPSSYGFQQPAESLGV